MVIAAPRSNCHSRVNSRGYLCLTPFSPHFPLRRQFKKKLAERLEHPHVPQAQLHTLPDSYKIKLRRAGYRLVYRVDDEEIVVIVVAVGKRDKNQVYRAAAERMKPKPSKDEP